jgi:hypothetical protein
LSVWILTLADGLFAGLLPLLLTLNALAVEGGFATSDLGALWYLLALAWAVSVMVASVAAWMGKDAGRIALLVLITGHYGMLAFNGFSAVRAAGATGWGSYGAALRAIFWIVLNYVYFLHPRVARFYT